MIDRYTTGLLDFACLSGSCILIKVTEIPGGFPFLSMRWGIRLTCVNRSHGRGNGISYEFRPEIRAEKGFEMLTGSGKNQNVDIFLKNTPICPVLMPEDGSGNHKGYI
jgi:hypothetical protein